MKIIIFTIYLISDPCCLGPNTVAGYLGETVTISCSYPEEFEENIMFFTKWNGKYFTDVIYNTETQRGRFSISDDRSSKVLSVNISDVREDDGGVYFCGAGDGMDTIGFKFYFTEIQLQVSAPGLLVIIIPVYVSVGLLLIGGSVLIFYKWRCKKTQGSVFTVVYYLEISQLKDGLSILCVKRSLWSVMLLGGAISEAEVQFRMKILIIFTLYLISGQVSCSDVIGYPGGFVQIYCNHHKHEVFNEYFCKVTPKECLYLEKQNPWSQKERLSLLRYPEGLLVSYRNLSLQDAGLYQCGEAGGWSHDVNLKVNSDLCCLGPKTVSGYLGETVTISCSYPEVFKRNYKFLYKQDDFTVSEVIRTTESPETQRGRFSISEDRRSKVLSVRISDVREDDGGIYFFGAGIGTNSVNYNSFFTEIQLQVSDPAMTMKPSTASTTSYRRISTGQTAVTDEDHSSSTSSPNMKEDNNKISHSASDYEEIRDIRPHSDTRVTPLYSTLQLPTALSTPPNTVYVTAQLKSNPPVQDTYSMVQLPKLTTEVPTYATVTFQRSPDSPFDTMKTFNQEESSTEHAPVRHPPHLELTTEY
ncbi:hypothetical protein MHYP_G00104990 [Metynnis hypsauchen]